MGFFNKPQQLWWRRALFQIHLWVGVVLCLYIAVIGATGALLVFRDDIERASFRDVLICKDCNVVSSVPLAQIIETVQAAFPERKVAVVYLPRHADENAVAMTAVKGREDSHYVFVSPATGKIVGETEPDRFWLSYVGQIHYFLLMGETGLIVNGIGAAFLLLLTLSGLVLWWPGIRHWKRGFGVRMQASWRRINFDLHSAIGFWTLAVLLVWSVSSIFFAWPQQVGKAMEHVSSIASLQPPHVKLPEHAGAVPMQMSALLEHGVAASPDAKLFGVFMPRGAKTPLTVLMAHGKPGDFFKMDYVYVNPFDGKVLAVWQRGNLPTFGSKAVVLLEKLHFGYSWGMLVKCIWFVLGMSFPLLSITGVLMYWNRVLSKKWKKLTAARA